MTDLIFANFMIFYKFVSASKVYCPRLANLNELQAYISWKVAQIDPAMIRRAMLDIKATAVKCIAAVEDTLKSRREE